jgi:uncharacterized membrane protein YphA (DoxX/SURF4 family)
MNKPALYVLRITIGSVMVVYGISQIVRPDGWYKYVPGTIDKFLPEPHFMRAHGIVNMKLGILFMSGVKPVYVSYATLAWWLSILPFAFYEDWHSGMRDIAIISGVAAVIFLLHAEE